MLYAIEHGVNINRLPIQRPLIGEDFHLVDKIPDAVGLLANQPCRLILVFKNGFYELRRTPDAGKRVLDFMGEHRRHAGNGTRRTAVGELQVDFCAIERPRSVTTTKRGSSLTSAA